MAEKVNVVIPTIGESVSEGTIGKWFFKEGDIVKKDQPLFELDSDKATLEVPASASGKLSILLPEGKTASVGTTVGVIESGPEFAISNGQKEKKSAAAISTAPAPKKEEKLQAVKSASPSSTQTPVIVPEHSLRGVGPAKRKAIREGSLKAPSSSEPTFLTPTTEEVRKPMSTIRKRIAERLVESQQQTATLTTFNEIDMSRIMSIRSKLKDEFASRYGVKLGFMSFFAKACIRALKTFPDVNARIEKDDIVYPQAVNLGIAVSTERGLVVPVIRNAQNMSYGELEKRIADLADRGRAGKLQIAEMSGGTFTITNGGVFGSLLSTPILNPPQSGILGMHKIEQRPRAIENESGKFEVQVRPMMYVALSYDHRLIDGATSVGFLVNVKDYLETASEDLVFGN